MGELPAFITGVPEESLKIPKEQEEFSLSINNNVSSAAGSGDASNTETESIEVFNYVGLLDKIILDLEVTQNNGGGATANFNVIVEVYAKEFKILQVGLPYSMAAGADGTANDSQTFDLNNAISVRKDDDIKYVLKIDSKDPVANYDIDLVTNLTMLGVRQR